ncbi:retrovirus-related pol polyprotein from transposon TNT 1-94 [Tanacetum coccineum]
MQDKKPDLSFLYVSGSLCYPTNDHEDLGKFDAKANIGIFIGYTPAKKAFRIYNRRTQIIYETIHVTFDELTTMASEQFNLGPRLHYMTPATLCTGLISKPVSQQPFQEAAALRDEVLADSPVSTSIDQDAPSKSIPSSQELEHSLIISQGSSSNMRQLHTLFEHLGRWTKDHPISNVIGDPSRSVSTRKQLETDARIESLGELVPYLDNMFLIKLKWIYKVKTDESGGVLKNKARLVAQGFRQEEGINFEESFALDNPSHVYKLKKALYSAVDLTHFTRHAGNDNFTVNDRARAKAVKSIKMKEWKPTGKMFKNVGYKWVPTGRTFTIVGTKCPLTRFTSTKIVPPRKPVKSTVITNIKPSSASQWRPKETNHASSSSAPKIVESRTANHLEPNNHMGSNVSISTCSSSVQCRIISSITAQQTKLDLELVPKENRIDIGKCNGRIRRGLTPREPTFQVVLDAIALTPCYPAFLITADVPEICPRVQDQDFDALPTEEDTVSFLRDLGHTGDITSLNDVVVDQMHDLGELLLLFLIEAYQERLVVLTSFVSPKHKSFVDDYLINTLRFVSRKEASQIYGAVLPECLTSLEMKESKAYKTYLGYATGSVLKIAENLRKPLPLRRTVIWCPVDKEPGTEQGKRVKRSAKKPSTTPAADDDIESDEDKGMDDTTNQFDDDKSFSPFTFQFACMVQNTTITSLLPIPVSVITTIPQSLQTFTPPLFLSIQRYRITALEKEVTEIKKDPLHTQVTSLVDEHLDKSVGSVLLKPQSTFKAVFLHLTEFDLKKILLDKMEKRHQSSRLTRLRLPLDQVGNLGDNEDEPRKETASRRDWFKKPTPPQEPTDPDWNIGKTTQEGPTQNWFNDSADSLYLDNH